MNRKPINLSVSRRGGFTLIELLVVIVIISILLGFIFVAAMDAAHRAEERATQSLITKLETALNDRLEALLMTRPEYNGAHYYMGNIYNSKYYLQGNYPNHGIIEGIQRAQVIAWYDYVKSELPDVFFIQSDPKYPLNFAATPFPGPPASTPGAPPAPYANYILPLGNTVAGPFPYGYGDGNQTNPSIGTPGTGIYGASYTAAAGIYKNLGYLPAGYDGIDNDQDGLIDNYLEGVPTNGTNSAIVQGNLARHIHKTARSEMLYAILVEGRGALGSVFSRDDFTDKEVQDTDNDGLPEFVDAWGQPLQFYRWPVLYHSDLQRGQNFLASSANYFLPPYSSVLQEREQDPLDVNQQLMAPAWWYSGTGTASALGNDKFPLGGASGSMSGAVTLFESFFHLLHEPMTPVSASAGEYWDRSAPTGAYMLRRAFYSKFLVVSWGQDGLPGIFGYYSELLQPPPPDANHLILYENPAPQYDPHNFSIAPPSLTPQLQQNGLDDISNHNLQSVGGIGGSSS